MQLVQPPHLEDVRKVGEPFSVLHLRKGGSDGRHARPRGVALQVVYLKGKF
jgi:hypothetical protein